MVKITWTDLAENDLQEIENYIAQDSVTFAFITSEKIINRILILDKFPRSGRIVPEFENPNIRCFLKEITESFIHKIPRSSTAGWQLVFVLAVLSHCGRLLADVLP